MRLPEHVRLEHGFLRVRCDKCHFERLVAFSCKKRGFCPSCSARRVAETAALLSDEVFPDVPLRQWVISFPFPLRYLFAAHPRRGLVTPAKRGKGVKRIAGTEIRSPAERHAAMTSFRWEGFQHNCIQSLREPSSTISESETIPGVTVGRDRHSACRFSMT